MYDLNPAERRALAGATCLIGLGLLGRVVLAPGPGAFEWQPSAGPVADLPGLASDVAAALAREQRAQVPLATDERIDPNAAPAEELRRLPGVGPRLAEGIVRERERRRFAVPADLARVPGIGEATVRRLAPHLALGDGPSAVGAPGTCAGIDVNRASAADLERLPGIGPALARRIVEHRRRTGPFGSVAELADVNGLGERSVERLSGRACAGKS